MRGVIHNKMPYRNDNLNPEIRGKLRQFYRLLISYNDFKQAHDIASYILKENLHDHIEESALIIEALNCAMIMAYCRPFSGNDPNAKIRIADLPSKFYRDLSEEEKEIHTVVIQDRNTLLAHSDSEAHDLRPQVLVVNNKKILIPWSNDPKAPLTKEATRIFQTLSAKLAERVFEERMKLEPILIHYFESVPIEDVINKNDG
jgi:hypothetical protein